MVCGRASQQIRRKEQKEPIPAVQEPRGQATHLRRTSKAPPLQEPTAQGWATRVTRSGLRVDVYNRFARARERTGRDLANKLRCSSKYRGPSIRSACLAENP